MLIPRRPSFHSQKLFSPEVTVHSEETELTPSEREESVSTDVEEYTSRPLYYGSVRLHDWKTTAKGGMSVDVGILDCPPTGLHPFKGLYCGKQNGQRLRIWFGELGDTPESVAPLHQGESLLMKWADDSVNGMSIKLLLDDGPDGVTDHPFKGLTIGKSEGVKLQMVTWAINDDEKLVDPRKTRKRIPFYELSEVRQSVILCQDPRFISYLKKHEARLAKGKEISSDVLTSPSSYAAEVLYAHLDITSRGQLGHDNALGRKAQKNWSNLLREYYDDYYNRR